VKTGSPEHVGLPLVIEIARQNEQQIRQPIGASNGGRVDWLLIGDFGYVSLGPAHDSARLMQMGRRMAAARQNKAIERRQARVQRIDLFFDPSHLPFGNAQRRDLRTRLRTSQMSWSSMCNRTTPMNRVRFVDASISRDAHVKLWQSRSVAKRRAAVVAGARVDPIEFHGDLPVRASGLLAPAQ
jgi:hypothetical protein